MNARTPIEDREVAVLARPVGDDDHAIGPAAAAVTLVEYGDYECPFCRKAHPLVQMLRRWYPDTLRVVYRNFPLTRIHPHAAHAAEAAESVAAHAGIDAFWAMHDLLFIHQRDSADALSDEHLARYAAEAGGDAALVLADLRDRTFEPRVRTDFSDGIRSGVNGTPTFFVNGVRFDGDWSDVRLLAAALEAAGARRSGAE